jgi:hypothetical protein
MSSGKPQDEIRGADNTLERRKGGSPEAAHSHCNRRLTSTTGSGRITAYTDRTRKSGVFPCARVRTWEYIWSPALCSSHCDSWATDASTIGSGRDLVKYGPCRVFDSDIAPNVARAGSLRCVLDARPSGVECNTHFGLALGDLGRAKPLALSSYVCGAVLRITCRLDSISRQFPASLPGRNRLSRPSQMGRNECGPGRIRCESRCLFPTTAKGRNLLGQGTLGSDSSKRPTF